MKKFSFFILVFLFDIQCIWKRAFYVKIGSKMYVRRQQHHFYSVRMLKYCSIHNITNLFKEVKQLNKLRPT